eukprot:g11030.t1
MSLSLSALLLTLTPSLRDLRVDFWWHLLVLWAQVLVAGGLSLGLCFVAWSDHDGLRIGMEQFAFLLTLLAVYVFGVRQLSVQCCGRRNAQYARRRSTMLWGDRGVPWEAPPRLAPPVSELLEDILAKGLAQTGTAVVDATSTCDRNRWMRRVARSVEVLEVPKLRHPLTSLLVWLNVLLLPALLVLVLLAVLLEVPLLAVFTLPLFTLSAPRPQESQAPITKGSEGLFYSTAQVTRISHLLPPSISAMCKGESQGYTAVKGTQCVVLVDPYSTGGMLAPELDERGYAVIALWTQDELIAYTRGCLDALRITDGATHTEVMMTETGPCLVEVNSRCHGAAGSWMPLARAMTGYTQVSACVDAFLSEEAFERLPDVPSEFLASGQVSMLISYHDGLVESTQFERVRNLPSVVFLEENLQAGRQVEKTIDLFSLIGMCVLVHEDPKVLDDDLRSIREMEQNGSFVLQPVCEAPVRTYEQSLVSLRGLLDNPQLLRQVHQLFLKSLVWIFVQLKKIPKGWLDCPLKREDANEVQCLLTDISWPPAVFQALHLPELLRVAAAAEASGPRPPSGSPPLIRPPQKAGRAARRRSCTK